MPSMVDMDPVGGIVNICEFLMPYFFTISFTSSFIFFIKKGDLNRASSLYFSKAPFSLAIKADFLTALFNIFLDISSQSLMASIDPYLIFNLINISAIPITPRPICLYCETLFCCSFNGWRGRPSSKTSFNPSMQSSTQPLNFSISNMALSVKGSTTNSAKFIDPSRQLPPAGRGSSAQGLTPSYLNSLSSLNRWFFLILSQNKIPGSA